MPIVWNWIMRSANIEKDLNAHNDGCGNPALEFME
jgi:hypothetical protein